MVHCVTCGVTENLEPWKGRWYCAAHKDLAMRTKHVKVSPGTILTVVERPPGNKGGVNEP
jgi:hypothetical protein